MIEIDKISISKPIMKLFKVKIFKLKSTLALLLVFCIIFLFIYIYIYNYISHFPKNDEIIKERRVFEKPPCTDCRVSNKYISTCGLLADNLGPGQKVISYSLYRGKVKDEFDDYIRGIEVNLQTLRQVYNSKMRTTSLWSSFWVIRIYSDLEMPLNLVDKYPNELFWCDVREILPGGYLRMFKMSWRFLPLGDPTVDILLSRDLDGILTEREYFAVDEWLKLSNYSFHSMRDHPLHNIQILGGMWGANNDILGLETAQRIRQNILEAGIVNDQFVLHKFIWTNFSDQVLAHDSYHCTEKAKYGDNSRPWPTQRDTLTGDFVGNPILRYKNRNVTVCPIECRPQDHKDWKYC